LTHYGAENPWGVTPHLLLLWALLLLVSAAALVVAVVLLLPRPPAVYLVLILHLHLLISWLMVLLPKPCSVPVASITAAQPYRLNAVPIWTWNSAHTSCCMTTICCCQADCLSLRKKWI
jgi:hypothetical protein